MGTGKRSGEHVLIPIASKIQRLSTEPGSDFQSQPDQDTPEFHLKIVICDKYKALRCDPKSQVQVGGVFSNVEYLDSKIAQFDESFHERLEWLEQMEAVVTIGGSSPDGPTNRVAFCAAKLIRRTNITQSFYCRMAKNFDESTLLAFDLFDRYGRLKDDYENHVVRKGSGGWGTRLDQGDILLIEDIIIEEPYRRLGLGKKIVNALLEITKRKTDKGFAAILWPESSKDAHFVDLLAAIVGDSGNIHRPEVFGHYDSVAIAWARSLGFRRIGSSFWFGRAFVPSPAITYVSLDDFDSPVDDFDPPVDDFDPPVDDFDPPVFVRGAHDTLPKSIQGKLSDKKFLQAAKQYLRGIPPDSQRWFANDKEANTLLHLAALYSLPKSVAWIMQQPASARLIEIRNSSGNTPLEALLQKLEIVRTRSWSGTSINVVAEHFAGHTIASAKCIALLQGVEFDTDEDLEPFRYGCTCGKCIDGYLSPRMRIALSHICAYHVTKFNEDLETMSGMEWIEKNRMVGMFGECCYKSLGRFRSVRVGAIRLFEHVGKCIDSYMPPEEQEISSIVASEFGDRLALEKFFKCGGSIKGVIAFVFKMARYADKVHTPREVCTPGEVPRWEKLRCDGSYSKEIKCRNDHEFTIVARMSGYHDFANHLRKTAFR